MGFTFATPTVVAGTVLVVEAIQSQNYAAGVSGWYLAANGDAEVANLIARGTFIGGNGTGPHVEIQSATSNIISLFTGNTAETAPGRVIGETNIPGQMASAYISSPQLGNGGSSVSAIGRTATGGKNEVKLAGDLINLQATTIMATNPVVWYDGLNVEKWHTVGVAGEPAFLNSWANSGGASPTAQFYKYPDGDVGLRGVFVNSVVAAGVLSNMFNLPTGYRPPLGISKQVPISGGAVRLQVGANGDVFHTTSAGSKTFIEIDIRFSTLT